MLIVNVANVCSYVTSHMQLNMQLILIIPDTNLYTYSELMFKSLDVSKRLLYLIPWWNSHEYLHIYYIIISAGTD